MQWIIIRAIRVIRVQNKKNLCHDKAIISMIVI